MLESWGVRAAENADQPTPWRSLAIGYEQSLLYGEHTWGASLGWVGHKLPWGPDWQKRTDERHARMIASWDEHSAYANNAQRISTSLLEAQLARLTESIDESPQEIEDIEVPRLNRAGNLSELTRALCVPGLE